MNSKTIKVISVIALIVIAVITNPKKQLHAEKVYDKIFPNDNTLFKVAVKPLAEQAVNYNNYVVFSIGELKHIKSLGLFGNVIVLTSDAEIQKELNTKNNEKSPKKVEKKKLSKEEQQKIDELIGKE